jgi:hypothetical protein
MCRGCKLHFCDQSKEWVEMSGDERQRFLLPVIISGDVAGFLLIGALWAYSKCVVKMPIDLKFSAFFLVFLPPLVVWFSFRAAQVFRSVHRYNARENTPAK